MANQEYICENFF